LQHYRNEGGATVSDINLTPNVTEWEHSIEILPESNDKDFSVLSDGFGTECTLANVNLPLFSGYDLKTVSNAQSALKEIDHVIDCLTRALSQAAANVQRLEKETDENSRRMIATEAAEGRIMDLDMAAEASALAKHNIRYQGSVAVLAQAQIIPNTILGLLINGNL
jgi:flagellin-like hook-associated protein FlgL